jgi:hypothetical protein
MNQPTDFRHRASLEQKINSLNKELAALNRRHRVYSFILVGAVGILLLCSPPVLALHQLLVKHFRVESFVNESLVALLGALIALLCRWVSGTNRSRR